MARTGLAPRRPDRRRQRQPVRHDAVRRGEQLLRHRVRGGRRHARAQHPGHVQWHERASPYAGLIADASGNLYGTTGHGGANGRGTVFELSPRRGRGLQRERRRRRGRLCHLAKNRARPVRLPNDFIGGTIGLRNTTSGGTISAKPPAADRVPVQMPPFPSRQLGPAADGECWLLSLAEAHRKSQQLSTP